MILLMLENIIMVLLKILIMLLNHFLVISLLKYVNLKKKNSLKQRLMIEKMLRLNFNMQFFKRIKILLLALILIPTLVFSDTTNYVDIAKPTEVNQDGIVIKDIKFNDLSKTTTMNYGLTGTITNNNDYDVTVDEMLSY